MNILPSKLEVLRELHKRHALDEVLRDDLCRLENGHSGEQAVLAFIEEFGEEHWIIRQNMWLDYYGKFECDLLLITRAGLYTFEIKNYRGKFEFRNSQCLINGKKVGHNAIAQAQKVHINLEQIFHDAAHHFNIQGVLTFIGQHNEVVVYDELEDLQVVMANQLRNYIWDIAKAERNYQGPPVDTQIVIQLLEKFETNNPFTPATIPYEISQQARKGICCSNCGSFEINLSRQYIACQCGMFEPREEAIVRTICEYGVIHYEQDLTAANLEKFFNGDISRKNLTKYLNKHFERIGSNRDTRYLNKHLPFYRIYHEFNLNSVKYLRLEAPVNHFS